MYRGIKKQNKKKTKDSSTHTLLSEWILQVIARTFQLRYTAAKNWQSIDFPSSVSKQFECDSFVDIVFINISALANTDKIIDAVNFVIEIRASGLGWTSSGFLTLFLFAIWCASEQWTVVFYRKLWLTRKIEMRVGQRIIRKLFATSILNMSKSELWQKKMKQTIKKYIFSKL